MDSVTIDLRRSKGIINRTIYGHFSEHIGGVIYDGLWVGEDSPVENIRGLRKALVDSFRKLNPPVLRWPGGCFAETYDWRDGIGPRDKRPRRVNWWYSHDHRLEPNEVGTHEFMDFCRLVGAEPYVAANMTSLSPLDIRDWIEYCNFPQGSTTLAQEREKNGSPEPFQVKYWGIGNENWGGGGQMSPEMCAREYIRYTTVCRPLEARNLRFVMCGPNGPDRNWTRRLMKEWSGRPWQEVPTYGMSVHYYTNFLSGSDECFFKEEAEWYDGLYRADFMRSVVDGHRAVMDEFDPERKVKMVVDEWGNWHKDGSGPSRGGNLFEQQSTMRDALTAAITLNIFNNRCDVVDMANVAQLCNNLHSLYLSAGEHLVETPNYFVFDLFKGHQDGKQLAASVSCRALEKKGFQPLETLSASASLKDSVLTLTLANLDLSSGKEVSLKALGGSLTGIGTLTVLSHRDPNACNTFDAPQTVHPVSTPVTLAGDGVISLPPACVACLTVTLA